MIDDYTRIKASLWNPLFRKQRLLNLVNSRVWYAGFNTMRLFAIIEASV